MVYISLVPPPNITINALRLSSGRLLVSIQSDSNISGITWDIETLNGTYKPLKSVSVNPNFTQLYFLQMTWTSLKLTEYYDGNYLGTNLLPYLETTSSSFGPLMVEREDQVPFIIGAIGITVASLIIGVIIFKATESENTKHSRRVEGDW
jgi:hypothetical protein